MKKTLIKKAIMLLASLGVLIAAGVYATTAWFTKTASVDRLTFDVAQWDFAAGYAVDEAELNVYTYSNVAGQKAAPGTNGYIDIAIDASASDVDVTYAYSVDESSMSQEFQDRLVFYHGTDWNHRTAFLNDSDYATGTVAHGQTDTLRIYWSWYYEMSGFNSGASEAEKTAWDEFDTSVGKDPEAFVNDMCAKVKITATQTTPIQTGN